MSHSNYRSTQQNVEQFLNSVPIPIDEIELDSVEIEWFGDGWLAEMIHDVSQSLETPVELAGVLGLAVVSAAITQKFAVLIEPGYFEPCNLWAICALEPSTRKTPVLKIMALPVREWERNQREIWKPEIERAKSERKTLEDVIKEKRKRAAKLEDPDEIETEKYEIAQLELELPEIPVIPKLLFDDCTPEGLGIELSQQQERKAYLESEADALFSMMQGRYADDPKLDIYLKSYSGESLQIDRVGRSEFFLAHPLLTLGICPQPLMIRQLGKKTVLVNRGLLARFIYFVPKSPVGRRTLDPCAISKSIQIRYGNGIKQLLDIEIPESPNVIKLADSAYECWKDWQREIEAMLRPDAILGHDPVKHWGGKLAGNTARIASILHCSEGGDIQKKLMGEKTMKNAINIARASISHSLKIHDVASTSDSRERARLILEFVKRKATEQISVRDLHAGLKGRILFGKADDIREGISVLSEFGWCIQNSQQIKSGRPSELIMFHPKLFLNSQLHAHKTHNIPF